MPPALARRERLGAQVFKGLQPAAEDGPRRLVALQENPANFARSLVEVEVNREFFIFPLSDELALRRRIAGCGFSGRLVLSLVFGRTCFLGVFNLGVFAEVPWSRRPWSPTVPAPRRSKGRCGWFGEAEVSAP